MSKKNDGDVIIGIGGDNTGFKESLKESQKEASSAGNKIASQVGSIAKTVGKTAIAATAAITGVVIKVGKASVEAYAEYEQLVGGVETLFKESAPMLQKYAEEAYKTAGLSANAYMEQATSFSASLIQSLGGDTKKAAEYANRAIIDMSDNANKMGTSMEMIQNAYSGFAKQNYTMLDNLKLGYGGTQEEMKRLVKDASEMTEVQKELGITVDGTSLSFGNIVNAISVVQAKMGIAGTTAKEASTTIQGSMGMVKAAWENLLVGFANADADLDTLVNNLLTSIGYLFENLSPVIERVGVGLASAIPSLLEDLVPMLAGILDSLLIALSESLPTIITSLVSFIPQIVETVFIVAEAIVDALPDIIEQISGHLPELVYILVDGLVALVFAIIENLDAIITPLVEVIPDILFALFDALIANQDILLEAITIFFMTVVSLLPTLIGAIIELLISQAELTFKAVLSVFDPIVDLLPEPFRQAINKVLSFFTNLKESVRNVFNTVKSWFNEILGLENSAASKSGNTPRRYAVGEDYVQEDWTPAYLDRGERVLTKEENRLFTAAGAMQGVNRMLKNSASSSTPVFVQTQTQDLTGLVKEVASLKKEVQKGQKLSVTFQADKSELGKVVYTLNKDQKHIVGLNLKEGSN